MRKILVVVDMQNDFITGSLGTAEAQAIVPNVIEKILYYGENRFKDEVPPAIFFTKDTHGINYLDTQEGRFLPVEHCIFDTEGWNLHPNINVLAKKYGKGAIIKTHFGSFTLPRRIHDLRDSDDVEIEIVGLCTDICVITNALILKTYFPEAPITVDATCCAGSTPEKHMAAIEVMRACQINIIE